MEAAYQCDVWCSFFELSIFSCFFVLCYAPYRLNFLMLKVYLVLPDSDPIHLCRYVQLDLVCCLRESEIPICLLLICYSFRFMVIFGFISRQSSHYLLLCKLFLTCLFAICIVLDKEVNLIPCCLLSLSMRPVLNKLDDRVLCHSWL